MLPLRRGLVLGREFLQLGFHPVHVGLVAWFRRWCRALHVVPAMSRRGCRALRKKEAWHAFDLALTIQEKTRTHNNLVTIVYSVEYGEVDSRLSGVIRSDRSRSHD